MSFPRYVAHADWGTSPQSRQVAVAEWTAARGYKVINVAQAQASAVLRGDLRRGLHIDPVGNGQAVVGFDFPIGFPRAFASRAGVMFFPDFLPEMGRGSWTRFCDVAAKPEEVSLHRPFYPARPGGTSQAHLYDGLGLSRSELRRRCDGRDAETMFWTLGGKQVGKAALSGWQFLVAGLSADDAIWPFNGDLATLIGESPRGVVVVETYPREFYRHIRPALPPAAPWSKTRQADRLLWMPRLRDWAATLGVDWAPEVLRRVDAGFSAGKNGEDEFDAVIGLVGMIAVIQGTLPSGEPTEDRAVLEVEGWMLGRSPSSIPG